MQIDKITADDEAIVDGLNPSTAMLHPIHKSVTGPILLNPITHILDDMNISSATVTAIPLELHWLCWRITMHSAAARRCLPSSSIARLRQ